MGLAAAIVAVGCTLVPSPDARDPLWEMAKLVIASATLILSGVAAYALTR